jgi:zinc transport system ATP-binding protein
LASEAFRLEDVWVYYGENLVLEAVNLTVYEGDFLALIGPNGGGKTTLLKTILGLIKPRRGRILVFGLPPVEARRLIGYVPQKAYFNKDIPVRVLDVVLMGRAGILGLSKHYGSEDYREAVKALETVGMVEAKDRLFKELSGGEQQRILIARALASNPKLLLLDEPTVSVDSIAQLKFYELLKNLSGKLTVILISHDVAAVYPFVNKIACLNRKLYYHDSKELVVEEVLEAYKCPVEMIAHGIPHRVLRKHQEDGWH